MLICLSIMLCLFQDPPAAGDSAAIQKAVLGYLDGWFDSDPAKMKMALHPNLVKFRVKTGKPGQAPFLEVMTAEELISVTHINQEWVKGKGHQAPEILFQNKEIAIVFAQSDGFYDLINLAKIGDDWKIVQVLWQVGQGKP
ncbi:MAG: nuclear transport factor 2 family protein [Acidobacteria bacterium]|nr:nuclear transport factor 2 family protein [Acidobacteriota bacterium]MCB9398897.1 nuclear transport factor 2 family protein [Acidobacteriota bacterium]